MGSYKDNTVEELFHLLKEGDENAFVEIYRRNWRMMFDAAYRRLHDESACEDLVQNIFTDLWERRATLQIENLTGYLLSAVKFQVIKYSTRIPYSIPLLDKLETQFISPLGSEDPLIEAESMELVKLWIAALPEKRREIFLMHYTDEMSTARIAEILGISQKNVQNKINTASKTIRDQLSKMFLLLIGLFMHA